MDGARLPPIMRRSPSPSPGAVSVQVTAASPTPQQQEDGDLPKVQMRPARMTATAQPAAEDRRSTGSQHSTGSFFLNESDNDEMDSLRNVNQTSYCSRHTEEKWRRKLKFFFMNPCEKWRARKKFPWKLLLQVIKIIGVTIQLVVFGTSRSSHVSFIEKSEIAFRHLYLKNWNPGYETLPYPPAIGQYAIYTIPDFYEHIDFALRRYNQTEELAIGTYHFSRLNDTEAPMVLDVTRYKEGRIFAFNSTYFFNPELVKETIPLGPVVNGSGETVFDTRQYLQQHNKHIYFDRVVMINLLFPLKTVHLRRLSKLNEPDCYQFNTKITFQNSDHNGQMLVTLKVTENPLDCQGTVTFNSVEEMLSILNVLFDTFIILISFASMLLCIRSVFRAHILRNDAVDFFKRYMGKELNVSDRLEFLNMWYVLIVINDALTIAGSIIKLQIENKDTYHYEICGLLLGIGNLLVWFGVLRYLGFFKKYNVLLLTLKRSAPNVLRFLVCAAVFYLGFCFCGWVVLGPYHIKFRMLSTTSECLFALINGDELFVTFASLTGAPPFIWWFSRVYLYLFISLFIYVVLSVFISVIMDTYETIKQCYEHGFPKGELHEFIDLCTDEPHSPLYRSDQYDSGCDLFGCCRKRRKPEEPTETTNLLQ